MTCRYCKKYEYDDSAKMLKYGIRHHAHFACYLDVKGTHGLLELHAWQLKQIPWLLVKERGIERKIQEAIASAEAKGAK